jgi:hypothetical protein
MMKNILILSILGGSLLCGLSPAQDTSTSPASPGAAQPQQDPASTTPSQTPQTQAPETQTSQTSNSQQQQPAAMQPSEVPPTEPQGTPSRPAPNQPAQTPTATTAPSSAAITKIAPGSIIPVQLAKTIDAKKTKAGDPVMATVTQDMKTQSGQVLVPKDTQVIGHVTEAQPRSKEQKESEVGIVFDHAVVKGDQMNLPLSIQAIVGNQPANPASAGGDQNAPATAGGSPTAGSPSASSGGGHGGSMGSTPSQPQNYPQASNSDTQAQTQPNPRPVINGTTEGVIGISDLKLATKAADATQGSVVSSEKNNVKLDKGTLMLLRVNP